MKYYVKRVSRLVSMMYVMIRSTQAGCTTWLVQRVVCDLACVSKYIIWKIFIFWFGSGCGTVTSQVPLWPIPRLLWKLPHTCITPRRTKSLRAIGSFEQEVSNFELCAIFAILYTVYFKELRYFMIKTGPGCFSDIHGPSQLILLIYEKSVLAYKHLYIGNRELFVFLHASQIYSPYNIRPSCHRAKMCEHKTQFPQQSPKPSAFYGKSYLHTCHRGASWLLKWLLKLILQMHEASPKSSELNSSPWTCILCS